MGPDHNVVSCFVFDHDGNVLLLKRHRDDWGGGLWAVPAGSIEQGESPDLALLREIEEETGLMLPTAEYLGTHHLRMPHATVRMRSYKAVVDHPQTIVLRDDEHEDYRWFRPAALLEEPDIIWATPSILRDFGLLPHFDIDPTLTDGSSAVRIS